MISREELLKAMVECKKPNGRCDLIDVSKKLNHPLNMDFSKTLKELEVLGLVKWETSRKYIVLVP